MPMKNFTLKDNIAMNYKEKILFAYAFLNTKSLNKPEVFLFNDKYSGKPEPGYIFGKDLYSIMYGGLKGKVPSWEEFYKTISVNETMPLICVAGCDNMDETRITLSILPPAILANIPGEFKNELLFTVNDEVSKSNLNQILNDMINIYNEYKDLYL